MLFRTGVATCAICWLALAGAAWPQTPAKPTTAPMTGAVDIICRDFRFNTPIGGAVSYRDASITMESVQVRDAAGALRTIYAPTRILIVQQFKPGLAAGPRGEGLAAGECGAAGMTLTGVVTGPTAITPVLQFANFPSNFFEVNKKGAEINVLATVNLPPCPSGIRLFHTTRQDANTFFVGGASQASCVP